MTTPLRLLTLALVASSTFCLTDCKKDKEPDPDNRSQQEMWLTSSGWNVQRLVQVQTTAAGVVTIDTISLAIFDPCHLDDLNHFNADHTFTVDDGPIKCQPPTPGTTWNLASNETEIVFGTATRGSKIATLTATTLALEDTDTTPYGTTIVQTITYAAR